LVTAWAASVESATARKSTSKLAPVLVLVLRRWLAVVVPVLVVPVKVLDKRDVTSVHDPWVAV